jgi:hypothetical protein
MTQPDKITTTVPRPKPAESRPWCVAESTESDAQQAAVAGTLGAGGVT